MPEILLQTVDLSKSFPVRSGMFGQLQVRLMAVDEVSLDIHKGETLGLVGESGCGKTTLGLTIMKLYEPTSGSILFEGQDIARLEGAGLRKHRRLMQMIFQDPPASLDPRMVVEEGIREPLDLQEQGTPQERHEVVTHRLRRPGTP